MSLLAATEIGLFRANPNANPKNNIKLVDPDTPGTPGTDTLTRNVATAPDTSFDGLNYIDKDGNEATHSFFRLDYPTGQEIPYTLPTSCTAAELQTAILSVIEKFEVDPVVTVTKTSTTFVITHKGAGTLDDIIIDGAAVATSRA